MYMASLTNTHFADAFTQARDPTSAATTGATRALPERPSWQHTKKQPTDPLPNAPCCSGDPSTRFQSSWRSRNVKTAFRPLAAPWAASLLRPRQHAPSHLHRHRLLPPHHRPATTLTTLCPSITSKNKTPSYPDCTAWSTPSRKCPASCLRFTFPPSKERTVSFSTHHTRSIFHMASYTSLYALFSSCPILCLICHFTLFLSYMHYAPFHPFLNTLNPKNRPFFIM